MNLIQIILAKGKVTVNFHQPAPGPYFTINPTMLAMKLFVNSEPMEMEAVSTLEDVLKQLPFKSWQGIAVALNNKVVSKAIWASCPVASEDKIVIIQATQGG